MFKLLAFAAVAAAFTSNTFAQADIVKIPTRFGELKTNSNSSLQFKGKTVVPEVTIISDAYVLSTYKLESSDVIFASQAAGNSCPGQFVFITVSTEGAKSTPVFGTCYDDGDTKPIQIDQTIAFSMKKMGGKGTSRYIYERGVVFENGKPVK
ncbi:MAG: hypothetical protein V4447_01740 [Pseudomonadota bacterium]